MNPLKPWRPYKFVLEQVFEAMQVDENSFRLLAGQNLKDDMSEKPVILFKRYFLE